MMNMYPILLTTITFFTTFLGGIFAVRLKSSIGLLAATASGILIGVSLFDMLPETLSMAVRVSVSVDNVMLLAGVGFLFLLTLHRHIFTGRKGTAGFSKDAHRYAGVLVTSEICAHSYIEGMAIGLGFQLDFRLGVVVALAIIAHDFSDGLSAVTVMLESGNTLKDSMRMLVFDAVTPLLGATTTLLIPVSGFYMALLLPFLAGGFLYLGASDLLPEAHERNPHRVTLAFTVLRFLLVLAIARILD